MERIQWTDGLVLELKDTDKHQRLPQINYIVGWILDLYLTRDMLCFEWGSGGSTVFLAQRSPGAITIDHDPEWYRITEQALEYNEVWEFADLKLIEPEDGEVEGYLSAFSEEYKGKNFERYVKSIDIHGKNTFDLVMVDGRSRSACLRHAAPKVKSGGLLVLDDSNRRRYKKAMDEMADYGLHRMDFVGPANYVKPDLPIHTTVWLKE